MRDHMMRIKQKNPIIANFFRQTRKKKRKSTKIWPGERAVDSEFLKTLLPPRAVVEALLSNYFVYYGRMHRILHIPAFYHELRNLWSNDYGTPAHVIIQLLLVMAIVWNTHVPSPLTLGGEPMLCHNVVVEWIHWADSYLNNCNIKRPNIIVLQIRCLLYLAKEANWTQRNQAWASVGTLVKLAMAAGCHLEPPVDVHNRQISTYNREMRRRIWATVVELDLRASMDRGMQPTVQQSSYNCNPPLNIDDTDLGESTMAYPEARSLNVATDTSYQAVMSRSLGLRLRVCAIVNAPQIQLSPDELLQLDEELRRRVAEIPHWTATGGGVDRPEFLLWRTDVETTLLRSQLSLHSCCVLSKLQGSVFNNCWQARFEEATKILYLQRVLVERLGKVAWTSLADLTLQAALSVCHHLYAEKGFGILLLPLPPVCH